MDPAYITNFEWTQLGKTLIFLWLFLLFIVLFAANMLLAHVMVPSLVSTGHLPEKLAKTRVYLYIVGMMFFGAAMFALAKTADLARIVENIYSRWYL